MNATIDFEIVKLKVISKYSEKLYFIFKRDIEKIKKFKDNSDMFEWLHSISNKVSLFSEEVQKSIFITMFLQAQQDGIINGANPLFIQNLFFSSENNLT